ncbi:MAG: hypothetical protein IJL67_11255 [Oscillospiraceae bacterium]|nr:hypothetical protein [Oscillospiraceae bacterium]
MNDKSKNEFIEVKLLTGETWIVSNKNVIGYCHKYNGYVTRNLLRSHKCYSKECRHLEKIEDNPYWAVIDQIKAAERRKRETARRLRQEKEKLQKEWADTAQNIANDYGYKVKVIEIRKVPKKKKYILFYISKISDNDCYRYVNLAKDFGASLNGKVELRHIIDIKGNYAVY